MQLNVISKAIEVFAVKLRKFTLFFYPSDKRLLIMTSKKIAVIQSNYLPWKGYFDIIRSVDVFVLYDEVQYTKRDFRNRNSIKTKQGVQWLTIPVANKGKYLQKVCETTTSEHSWLSAHPKSLMHAYAHAPYFTEVFEVIKQAYEEIKDEVYLSKINFKFLKTILSYLNCPTELVWSMDIPKNTEGKNDRLLEIVKALNGNHYLSGPAAKEYMDVDFFKTNNITVSFADYSGYPSYNQPFGEFVPNVSILDLLFCEGRSALNFMKKMD